MNIMLVLDLVLVGALVEVVEAADRKTEDYDAAAEISTSLNVAAMQAKLTVEDESKAVIKSGKAERTKTQGTEKWLDTLETLEGQIFAHGITYSWYHPASSYESAINGNHHVNWRNLATVGPSENGSSASRNYVLHFRYPSRKGCFLHQELRVFHREVQLGSPGKCRTGAGRYRRMEDAHLCLRRKGFQQNMLWYTAGGSDVSSKNLGPRTKKYANKNITVLIRINYDKIPKN